MRSKRGFTLMELLVVVAIVAILTAVAISVFSSSLEKARSATCAANRRSLQGLLAVTYMTEGEHAVDPAYQTNKSTYTCPDGGILTYQLSGGRVDVFCSRHTGSFGSPDTMGKLETLFGGVTTNYTDSGAKDSISTSLSGSTKALLAAMEKAGIDLASMGAVSWRYDRSSAANKLLYWTPVDIQQLKSGDKLPVLRYNMDTKTYTVWISTLALWPKDSPAAEQYLALTGNSIAYKPSTSQDKSQQTYENALTHFQAAMRLPEYAYLNAAPSGA